MAETQAEWLKLTDPIRMIKAARARMKHRKLRLFAVACCHRIERLLPDPRSHEAIATAEQFSDGVVTASMLCNAREAAAAACRDAFETLGKTGSCLEWAAEYSAHPVAFKAAESVSWMSKTAREVGKVTDADFVFQCAVIRDTFGNPFRPVSLDVIPSTLTPAVLAMDIYDKRAFEQMPELANALEKAGCTDKDVLEHCRGPGPHVRGCWVLDLILGRE